MMDLKWDKMTLFGSSNVINCDSGGGGANTKVPDMYGVGGGVFGTQNTRVYFCTTKGVSIFYPESQKYKWYFFTHIS